ncbi:MAG: hypothetical protein MI861_24050 [Pirellulales bacterium]|nr:hypothetical protein [Pirellulales bacterium]
MSRKNISRISLVMLAAVTVGQLFHSATATAGLFGTGVLDQTGNWGHCPKCRHHCKLEANRVEEEKKCFEVETKVICIPRVVFPWQKPSSCGSCDGCNGRGCRVCVNNGARIREVKILKTKKYKCPKCEYTWSAEKSSCGGGCCDTRCAGTGCDSGVPVPTPAAATTKKTYDELMIDEFEPVRITEPPLPAPLR